MQMPLGLQLSLEVSPGRAMLKARVPFEYVIIVINAQYVSFRTNIYIGLDVWYLFFVLTLHALRPEQVKSWASHVWLSRAFIKFGMTRILSWSIHFTIQKLRSLFRKT